MKTCFPKRDEAGAVVITTALCISAVTTLLVVGYLWLLMGQSKLVKQSQNWNRAMAIGEAGVEEALAQLNWGPTPGLSDLSTNGWGETTTSTSGVDSFGPPGQRTLSGGYYYSSFTAPLTVTNGSIATIYSTGFVAASASGPETSRRVQVTAKYDSVPSFPNAISVVSNFTANGNSIATDSWDSQSNSLSANGLYDSSKVSTNGGVGAEYGAVNLGQHTIDGNLYLGPDAQYSGSGTVDGTVYTNYNVQIPDAQLPNEDWQDAVATNAYSISTNVVAGRDIYSTNSLGKIYNFTQNGSYRITVAGGSYPIQIGAGITVNLDIQQTTFNPASVTILGGVSDSGTVYMYQESGTASLSGNTAAGGNTPENFIYYGLPGVTSVSLGGSSSFIGGIYAPEATVTLKGGGGSNNLMGAIVAQSLTLSGHYNVHYDQALASIAQTKGFVPTSWREF